MKKGLKIALISIVSFLAVAGATFGILYATRGEYVRNWWALLTKSDSEYFEWVTEREVTELTQKIAAKKVVEASEYTSEGQVSVSLSKEFGNLIGLKDFEGIDQAGIKVANAYYKDSSGTPVFGIKLSPNYNRVDVIDLAASLKKGDKKLFIGVPSFTDSFITTDLIPEVSDKFSLPIALPEEKVWTAAEDLFMRLDAVDSDKFVKEAAWVDQLLELFTGSLQDITLDKKAVIKVNNLEKEVTELKGKLTRKEVKNIARSILEFVQKDSDFAGISPEINQKMAELMKNFDELYDGALGEKSINAELSLYVDNKGEIVGLSVKPRVDELALKFQIMTERVSEAQVDFQSVLEVNTIRAFSFNGNVTKADNRCSLSADLVPGEMIKSFLKLDDILLEVKYDTPVEMNYDSNNSRLALILKQGADSNGNMASVIINCDKVYNGVAEGFAPDNASKEISSLEGLADSDFTDVGRLVEYAVDRLTKINNIPFNNFLDIQLFNGEQNTLEVLQGLQESGICEILSAQLKAMLVPETENPDISIVPAIPDNPDVPDTGSDITDPEGPDVEPDITDPEGPDSGEDNQEQVPEMVYVPRDYEFSLDFLADYVSELDFQGIEVDARLSSVVEEDPTILRTLFLEKCNQDSHFEAPKDYAVQLGDEIYFSACAIMGGIPLSSYSYDDCYALMGRYDYGDGIDDTIVGMKVGDTKDLVLTLDERYGMFAGYTGTFRITCTGIYRYVKPEWTEDYIVGCLGYSSLEDCDRVIGNTGESTVQFTGECMSDDEIKEIIFAKLNASYQLQEFDSKAYRMFFNYENRLWLKNKGMCFDVYFENYVAPSYSMTEGYYDYAKDFFAGEMKDKAKYAYIARNADIKISAEEAEAYINGRLENGETLEDIFAKKNEEDVFNSLIIDRCDAYVLENANVIKN